jgi:B12 binding domain/Radical SAM superfamily/Protein of unknown function (DUF4080)
MQATATSESAVDILLVTLNARYSHASLGLRYLKANLGELEAKSAILELVIAASSGMSTETMLEKILARTPRIVGLGVYIWNIDETTRLVAQLKRVAPNITVVVGGPEVSFVNDAPEINQLSDFVITGQADHSFKELCEKILSGSKAGLPLNRIVVSNNPELSELRLPYHLYSDEDLAHRHIYFEASRGCPFKCEFCLSALDKTAWPFELDSVIQELDALYQRGLRRFKFVDRTFNLKISVSQAILAFFLNKLRASPEDSLFVHFELVPDHLPDSLKESIAAFPPGVLQFEIGIQTWNPEIQALISRRQDNEKAAANIAWLSQRAHAHLHVDLIVGLPGETIESFGSGFDKLYALEPHEIQVGILKRLRGAPIDRHTQSHAMVYNPNAPYNVLSTQKISFTQMQRMQRFARYWDMFANSGRFKQEMTQMLAGAPFTHMMNFADWLYANTDATHRLALTRQTELLANYLANIRQIAQTTPIKNSPEKVTTASLDRQSRHLKHTL